MSHKPGGRLPSLSARPAVTPATLKRFSQRIRGFLKWYALYKSTFYLLTYLLTTNFAAWWTEAQWVWTVCLRTVIRQRRGCDLNPGPSERESSTLTTRLPSHPCTQLYCLFYLSNKVSLIIINAVIIATQAYCTWRRFAKNRVIKIRISQPRRYTFAEAGDVRYHRAGVPREYGCSHAVSEWESELTPAGEVLVVAEERPVMADDFAPVGRVVLCTQAERSRRHCRACNGATPPQ